MTNIDLYKTLKGIEENVRSYNEFGLQVHMWLETFKVKAQEDVNQYSEGYNAAIKDMIESEVCKYYCMGDLCLKERDCKNCRIDFLNKLKERNNEKCSNYR